MGILDFVFGLNVNKMMLNGDVEGLIKALRHHDYGVRRCAAEALGKVRDKRAIEPLIQALEEDRGWGVGCVAAEALGEIRDNRAIEPLIQALKHKDWYEYWKVQECAADALGKIGEPAVKPLVHALKDEDCFVRENAARALRMIGWEPKDDIEKVYYLIAKSE